MTKRNARTTRSRFNIPACAGLTAVTSLILALTGCGGSSTPEPEETAQEPTIVVPDDASWRGALEFPAFDEDGETPQKTPRRKQALPDEVPAHTVMLVHGLDDPGWLWDDLIPVLLGNEYHVSVFTYPNDGPIVDAAADLAIALRHMRARGCANVDIVGHSMGGLVAREMLTSEVWYDGDGHQDDPSALPTVDHLIMVGTPNHGSEAAKMRSISGMTEKVSRFLSGRRQAPTPRNPEDAGQAGVDLLPNSEFITALNARPVVEHTALTIIAAQWLNVDPDVGDKVDDVAHEVAENESTPKWLKDMAESGLGDKLKQAMNDASGSLGDGVVTVESTRLTSVDDHQIVNGNHWSMLARVMSEDEDMPPAIPIILDRLGGKAEDDSADEDAATSDPSE